jgi:predicted RNA-binding Zn ribbon-like protein
MKPITVADLEFRFTSGRLCLDFLATLGERGHRNVERLTSPVRLAEWSVAAGLLDDPPLLNGDDLAAARALRVAAERVVLAFTNGGDVGDEDVAALNAAARRPPPRPALSRHGRSVRRTSEAPGPAILAAVSLDVLELVAHGDPARLRRCADPACGMWFEDGSRAGTRQWCAVEGRGCGNKAKKRAFRHRHASA